MAGNRCARAGCGRFVARGAEVCDRHRWETSGDGEARPPDVGVSAGREDGQRLSAVLARAAANPGLEEEVGAVRVTLARLLREEEADPLKVAMAVARLAAVGVQAARARRALAEGDPDDLLAAVEAALGDGV